MTSRTMRFRHCTAESDLLQKHPVEVDRLQRLVLLRKLFVVLLFVVGEVVFRHLIAVVVFTVSVRIVHHGTRGRTHAMCRQRGLVVVVQASNQEHAGSCDAGFLC